MSRRSALAFVFTALALGRLAADGASAARIDAIFIREYFDAGMAAFQTKEGLRGLYEECVAIDPAYWRTAYVRMLYEDMIAEDRAGLLKALGASQAAWNAYAADPRNLEALEANVRPSYSDMGSEEAFKALMNRLQKQSNAIRILGTEANLLEAMDERDAAENALSPLIESANALARYEGLMRLYWLKLKYASLAEGEGLLSEVEAAREEVESDLSANAGIESFYTSNYKQYYAIGFGNEAAALYGYLYDVERSMAEYQDLVARDRAYARAMGLAYSPDMTLLSNIQLLRLSLFDFEGMDANHVDDDSFYAFLQVRHEALLSRGRPLEARAGIRDSTADPRYFTEGMRRLFRGQASLLAGDARAAMTHLEYAAGYREVFRDISYTLSNYQARVYSELASACAAERGLRRLSGRAGIASLPLRAKEFYYRFLLASNLRAHPDYATLFSPYMNSRDMSMSPYASAEILRSLDGGIAELRIAEIRSMDRRPRAAKYYDLYEAEIALSSRGGLPRAAVLLEGDPPGSHDSAAPFDPGIAADERLYLAMAWSARARLAQRRKDEAGYAKASLAAYRTFPSYAATMGFRFEFAELEIADGVGGAEGKVLERRIRKAARKWRVSWRKGRADLPRPVVEMGAEGEGTSRKYVLTLRIEDPGAPLSPSERETRIITAYSQDLRRGDYPDRIMRAVFGIRSEDDEAAAATAAPGAAIPGEAVKPGTGR